VFSSECAFVIICVTRGFVNCFCKIRHSVE